jgi:hypothetical protein
MPTTAGLHRRPLGRLSQIILDAKIDTSTSTNESLILIMFSRHRPTRPVNPRPERRESKATKITKRILRLRDFSRIGRVKLTFLRNTGTILSGLSLDPSDEATVLKKNM